MTYASCYFSRPVTQLTCFSHTTGRLSANDPHFTVRTSFAEQIVRVWVRFCKQISTGRMSFYDKAMIIYRPGPMRWVRIRIPKTHFECFFPKNVFVIFSTFFKCITNIYFWNSVRILVGLYNVLLFTYLLKGFQPNCNRWSFKENFERKLSFLATVMVEI